MCGGEVFRVFYKNWLLIRSCQYSIWVEKIWSFSSLCCDIIWVWIGIFGFVSDVYLKTKPEWYHKNHIPNLITQAPVTRLLQISFFWLIILSNVFGNWNKIYLYIVTKYQIVNDVPKLLLILNELFSYAECSKSETGG